MCLKRVAGEFICTVEEGSRTNTNSQATPYKITEIFCLADVFCNYFEKDYAPKVFEAVCVASGKVEGEWSYCFHIFPSYSNPCIGIHSLLLLVFYFCITFVCTSTKMKTKMERTVKPIDFSRKKKLHEVLEDAYQILTGHSKLLFKLAGCWMVVVLIFNVCMWFTRLYEPLLIYMVNSDQTHLKTISFLAFIGIGLAVFLLETFKNLLMLSFVKGYIRQQRDNSPLTFDTVLSSVGRLFPKGMFIFLLVSMLLLLTLPVSLYTVIPLSFFLIAYLVHGSSLGKAFREGFSLGSRYWWRTFALSIIVAIFCTIVLFVFYTPFLILLYVLGNSLASGSVGEGALLPGYFWVLVLLSLFLAQIGVFIVLFYANTTQVVHYYNVKARREEQLLNQRSSTTDQI